MLCYITGHTDAMHQFDNSDVLINLCRFYYVQYVDAVTGWIDTLCLTQWLNEQGLYFHHKIC